VHLAPVDLNNVVIGLVASVVKESPTGTWELCSPRQRRHIKGMGGEKPSFQCRAVKGLCCIGSNHEWTESVVYADGGTHSSQDQIWAASDRGKAAGSFPSEAPVLLRQVGERATQWGQAVTLSLHDVRRQHKPRHSWSSASSRKPRGCATGGRITRDFRSGLGSVQSTVDLDVVVTQTR
jgi:hypothetical protein